jgi:hypothetical protein
VSAAVGRTIGASPRGKRKARLRAYVELARASNLPTIFTQTAAGIALAEPSFELADCVLLGAGFSCAYSGGMFLNDAFDWRYDVRARPDRPIPSGRVMPQDAFRIGGALLAIGALAIGADGALHGHALPAFVAALTLVTAIVLYDVWHRDNAAAPLVMGACRALVYLGAACAVAGRTSTDTGTAAAAMLAYVAGLSQISRAPRLSLLSLSMLLVAPFLLAALAGSAHDVGALAFVVLLGLLASTALLRAARGESQRATVLLLAGMSLVDAVVLARFGHFALAVCAAALVPITKALQRVVRGT